MTDDTQDGGPLWPREIWAAEREAFDVTGMHVFSQEATVPRPELDRATHFHRYVDADVLEAIEKYYRVMLASRAAGHVVEPGYILTRAAGDVLAERRRQVQSEGWTPDHDDIHVQGELARAAACYAWAGAQDDEKRSVYVMEAGLIWFDTVILRRLWPWDRKWWKPKDRRRDLVKAGALILGEIERLDREAAKTCEEQGNG